MLRKSELSQEKRSLATGDHQCVFSYCISPVEKLHADQSFEALCNCFALSDKVSRANRFASRCASCLRVFHVQKDRPLCSLPYYNPLVISGFAKSRDLLLPLITKASNAVLASRFHGLYPRSHWAMQCPRFPLSVGFCSTRQLEEILWMGGFCRLPESSYLAYTIRYAILSSSNHWWCCSLWGIALLLCKQRL